MHNKMPTASDVTLETHLMLHNNKPTNFLLSKTNEEQEIIMMRKSYKKRKEQMKKRFDVFHRGVLDKKKVRNETKNEKKGGPGSKKS